MLISLIVIADMKNGIGKDNKLLVHLPGDLKYFKKLTMGHHVLMGRRTYDSMGKALPGRTNIVISRSVTSLEGCLVFPELHEGIAYAKHHGETELFIIGGEQIFRKSIGLADKIYLTRIEHFFEADVFFPSLGSDWELLSTELHDTDDKNPYKYRFEVYERMM
jgi:dihydrofolate reductase